MKTLGWLTALFNIGKPRQMFGLFNRRRNNRRTILASLLASAGVSALIYGLRRRDNQTQTSLQGENLRVQEPPTNVRQFRTAMAEFANEILPENENQKRTQTITTLNKTVNNMVNPSTPDGLFSIN